MLRLLFIPIAFISAATLNTILSLKDKVMGHIVGAGMSPIPVKNPVAEAISNVLKKDFLTEFTVASIQFSLVTIACFVLVKPLIKLQTKSIFALILIGAIMNVSAHSLVSLQTAPWKFSASAICGALFIFVFIKSFKTNTDSPQRDNKNTND